MNLRKRNPSTLAFRFTLLPLLICAIADQSFGFQSRSAKISATRRTSVVIVSIPDRKLAVITDGRIRRVFPVSVGAAASPSPTGTFQITTRIPNPTYYHPGVVIPAGLNNPLGPRWLGLNKKSFGIHGTNPPPSIGAAASHGCFRLRNSDVVALYSMLAVGDIVEIHGERDTTTVRTFGSDPIQQANAKPTVATSAIGRGRS